MARTLRDRHKLPSTTLETLITLETPMALETTGVFGWWQEGRYNVTCKRQPYRKVDIRLPGKGNSNAYGARPVHQIISMIEWIRTSRLSMQNYVFNSDISLFQSSSLSWVFNKDVSLRFSTQMSLSHRTRCRGGTRWCRRCSRREGGRCLRTRPSVLAPETFPLEIQPRIG